MRVEVGHCEWARLGSRKGAGDAAPEQHLVPYKGQNQEVEAGEDVGYSVSRVKAF